MHLLLLSCVPPGRRGYYLSNPDRRACPPHTAKRATRRVCHVCEVSRPSGEQAPRNPNKLKNLPLLGAPKITKITKYFVSMSHTHKICTKTCGSVSQTWIWALSLKSITVSKKSPKNKTNKRETFPVCLLGALAGQAQKWEKVPPHTPKRASRRAGDVCEYSCPSDEQAREILKKMKTGPHKYRNTQTNTNHTGPIHQNVRFEAGVSA